MPKRQKQRGGPIRIRTWKPIAKNQKSIGTPEQELHKERKRVRSALKNIDASLRLFDDSRDKPSKCADLARKLKVLGCELKGALARMSIHADQTEIRLNEQHANDATANHETRSVPTYPAQGQTRKPGSHRSNF